jgi:hypothetical protein
MKAKDLADDALDIEFIAYFDRSFSRYVFTENQFKQFCKQLCEEQRELCNEAIRQRDEFGYSVSIPNKGDKIFDFVDMVKMPEL